MARLYFDEDPKGRLAAELRLLGHDVLTAREDGRADQSVPDGDVLARATELGRAVVTCNRKHFKRLHRATAGAHGGIITITQRGDPVTMARRLHERLESETDLAGRVLHIYRGG